MTNYFGTILFHFTLSYHKKELTMTIHDQQRCGLLFEVWPNVLMQAIFSTVRGM